MEEDLWKIVNTLDRTNLSVQKGRIENLSSLRQELFFLFFFFLG